MCFRHVFQTCVSDMCFRHDPIPFPFLKLANKNKGFCLICDKWFSGHSHKLRYNRLRDVHPRDYNPRNIRRANGAPLRCARQISCALVNVLALPPAGALEALEAASVAARACSCLLLVLPGLLLVLPCLLLVLPGLLLVLPKFSTHFFLRIF
jgi:hypothetical protein